MSDEQALAVQVADGLYELDMAFLRTLTPARREAQHRVRLALWMYAQELVDSHAESDGDVPPAVCGLCDLAALLHGSTVAVQAELGDDQE